VEALMKRTMLSLEYDEWEKAGDIVEQALNMDSENAEIYVAKLMAETRSSKEENLSEYGGDLSEYTSYQKAMRFGDAELRTRLEQYNAVILERRQQEQAEKAREKEIAAEIQKQEQTKQKKTKWRAVLMLAPVIILAIIAVALNGAPGSNQGVAAFERLLDLPYLVEIMENNENVSQLQGRGLRLNPAVTIDGRRTHSGRPTIPGIFHGVMFAYELDGQNRTLDFILIRGADRFDGIEIDFDDVESMISHFSQTYGVEVGQVGTSLHFTLDDIGVEIRQDMGISVITIRREQ